VWWVRFNRNPGDLALALGSADKTARVWRLGTAERLQTDPAALEAEAERETGLQVERESLDFRIVNEKRAASRGGAR